MRLDSLGYTYWFSKYWLDNEVRYRVYYSHVNSPTFSFKEFHKDSKAIYLQETGSTLKLNVTHIVSTHNLFNFLFWRKVIAQSPLGS